MFIVKERRAAAEIFIPSSMSHELGFAAVAFCEAIFRITGVRLKINSGVEQPEKNGGGIILRLSETLCGGFSAEIEKDCLIIEGKTPSDVYFGAADVLEKNSDIVFARGAKGEDAAFTPADSFEITYYGYKECSPFEYRTFNICGVGSEGLSHADGGTAQYLSLNKINATAHYFDERWRIYGLTGSALHCAEINNLDGLIDKHPDYFMTAADGSPMKALGGHSSYLNYYSEGAAVALAERLVSFTDKTDRRSGVMWVMPDDPYFYMLRGGVRLHEQPFTADDGTVVYPHEKRYKSTVYFNFVNRVAKYAVRLGGDVRFSVFAYLYSETAPATNVDPHVRVIVAPISTNERYSYIDERDDSNGDIRRNIEKWAEKTDNLGIYTYWLSFKGDIYSRPSLGTVKENLLWFRSLGIKEIIAESKTDCSDGERLTEEQRACRTFYDMNEAYIWAVQKLMWDPSSDVNGLLRRFARSVYKECADDMLEYFSLIQEGWDKSGGTVWYNTGGDIYYLQFVIGAGIADKVKKTVEKAARKARTPSVIRKTRAIEQVVREQLERYSGFVREEAFVKYCGEGESRILSAAALDYMNNPDSVWNGAVPLRVLRDFDTFAFYPEQTRFSCRMLYDDRNIYIGYTVFDDRLAKVEKSADGTTRAYRADGSEVISYAETYIGSNILNQSVYYGYISGFYSMRDAEGEFYENSGLPVRIPLPDGVKDVKFVKADGDKDKRYYFHVQVIPLESLGTSVENFRPYGSFVYYTDRYGRAGWMGYGLWSKQNFSPFTLCGGRAEGGLL